MTVALLAPISVVTVPLSGLLLLPLVVVGLFVIGVVVVAIADGVPLGRGKAKEIVRGKE